jgi:biotin carboxyl carrier protein
MPKLARFALFAVCAAALLCAGVFHTAQDAPAQPVDTETRSATAAAARITHLNLEYKGYNGELRVKTVVAPGVVVQAGEVVAVVEAPDYAEELQAAQANAQAVRSRVAMLDFSLKWDARYKAVREQRAKLNHEAAKSALEHFLASGKKDRITWAELSVQYNIDSIEDQEDELRQLEALYKGNDLAKESQDIVLKRAKRRLEQSRTRLKLAQTDFDRITKKELPQEELNLQNSAENAQLDYESTQERAKQGITELFSALVYARQELEGAEKRLNRLLDGKALVEIKAPHAGLVLHGGDAGVDGVTATLAAGQKVGNGQHVATVVDTSTLRITVGIDPAAVRIAKMQRNTAKVEVAAMGISLEARVVSISPVVRDEKVNIVLEVTPKDSGLMHGQKVQVTLSAGK